MDFKVVRARGLPWSVTPDDIAVFFAGCDIKNGKNQGVHIIINDEGRPSGECYVELLTQSDLKRALEKNHNYLGKRYIEVYESSPGEMQQELDKSGDPANRDAAGRDNKKMTEPIIRLRGLPFKSSDEDITSFFEGLSILKIQLCQNSKGECSGEGFVEFNTMDDAVKALEKHKEKMDWRYIEVFKASRKDWRTGPFLGGRKDRSRPSPYDRGEKRGGRGSSYDSYSGGGYSGDARGGSLAQTGAHLVLMRGLPFKATEGDIIKFFAPNIPKQVEILFDNTDRPSGEAYVDFYTHAQALTGMKKDKESMGHRYIELFLESREDAPGQASGGYGPAALAGGQKHMVLMRGLPFKASEGDIIKFFAPNIPKEVEILMDKTNRPSGEAYADFYTHADAMTAMANNNKEMGEWNKPAHYPHTGKRYIELFLESKEDEVQYADYSGGYPVQTYGQQGYSDGYDAYGYDNQSYGYSKTYEQGYSAAEQGYGAGEDIIQRAVRRYANS